MTRRFAAWVPGFAILRYVGRRSGKLYRTPINVFRREGDYIFGLTYSSDVQWVKNVLVAGAAELEQRGRIVKLRDPKVFVDPAARFMPLAVRPFLRFMRVSEFLRMSPA